MGRWVIVLFFAALFVGGLLSARSFRHTRYGKLVLLGLGPMVRWSVAKPWRAFPFLVLNNAGVFLLIALSSIFPGGALWLAPFFGVQSSLIGEAVRSSHPRPRFRLPTFVFMLLFFLVLALEGAVMVGSAVEATMQSMDWSFDPAHALGLVVVMGPIFFSAIVFCGLFETLLIWSEPKLAKPPQA